MGLKIVTAFINTGRAVTWWQLHQRPLSFYTDGVSKLRDFSRKYAHELYVFGDPAVADKQVSYSGVIELIGKERFDKIEGLRNQVGAPSYPTCCITWYVPLMHLKYILLKQIAEAAADEDDVVWMDAGIVSHGWFNMDTVMSSYSPMQDVRAFKGTWRRTWDGRHMDKLGTRHPGWAPAGTIIGGPKQRVLEFCDGYLKLVDETVEKGAVGTDEDILTVMYARKGHPTVMDSGLEFFKL